VLDDHRRVLRAAFEEADGYEVDTQGDAFFVAFARATDAAAAAVAGQRALLSRGTRRRGCTRGSDPGSRPTNLPLQPTALVGRGRELDDLCALVRTPGVRLVALTGPGGTGKTRLALQAAAELADDFSDGTFFVSLAPIEDPELVLVEVAQTIGVNLNAGQTIAGFLSGKELLLVLDNLEQLLPAAPGIAELLASAAGLTVIATSREPLRIRGERVYPVPPLREEEAVELFAERACAARPHLRADGRERRCGGRGLRASGRPSARGRARRRARHRSVTRSDAPPHLRAGDGRRPGTSRSGSARCMGRSTGATGCWTRTTASSSRARPSSSEGSRSR
jgi:hypothetical protein